MGRASRKRGACTSRLVRSGHATTPVMVQLAAALHRFGDVVAAEDALQRAIAADPGAYRPRYALGTLLLLQDRFDAALPQLEAAIAADPRTRTRSSRTAMR